MSGKITKMTGPVSFLVELDDGKIVRRHQDQLRCKGSTMAEPDASSADVLDWDILIASESSTPPESNTDTDPGELVNNPSPIVDVDSEPAASTETEKVSPVSQPSTPGHEATPPVRKPSQTPTVKQYPRRNRMPPDYLRYREKNFLYAYS